MSNFLIPLAGKDHFRRMRGLLRAVSNAFHDSLSGACARNSSLGLH
jgi:hypothetical protein